MPEKEREKRRSKERKKEGSKRERERERVFVYSIVNQKEMALVTDFGIFHGKYCSSPFCFQRERFNKKLHSAAAATKEIFCNRCNCTQASSVLDLTLQMQFYRRLSKPWQSGRLLHSWHSGSEDPSSNLVNFSVYCLEKTNKVMKERLGIAPHFLKNIVSYRDF